MSILERFTTSSVVLILAWCTAAVALADAETNNATSDANNFACRFACVLEQISCEADCTSAACKSICQWQRDLCFQRCAVVFTDPSPADQVE